MKLSIWSVFANDRLGPRTTLHLSERDAYEEWFRLQFPDSTNEDEREDRDAARSFINDGDYDGLWEWRDDRLIGDPLDDFLVEEHVIELPKSGRTRLGS